MPNFRIILIIPIIFLSIFNSCNENPFSYENYDPSIIGTVTDQGGNPIEGVNIHYIPQLIGPPLYSLKKPLPSTIINFTIPNEAAKVDLVILRYGSRDTIAWLIRNEQLRAGLYSMNPEPNLLTNGVYIYVLKYNSVIIEKNFLMYITDWSELAASKPLTVTDKNGKFKLPYSILALGYSFIRTGIESPEPIGTTKISDVFSLFLVKGDTWSFSEDIKADTNFCITKRFILKTN